MKGVWILASFNEDQKGYYPAILGVWSKKKGAYNYARNSLLSTGIVAPEKIPLMLNSLFKGTTKVEGDSYIEYAPGLFLTCSHLVIVEDVEPLMEVPKPTKKGTKKISVSARGITIPKVSAKGKTPKVSTSVKKVPAKASVGKLEKKDEHALIWYSPTEDLLKKLRATKKFSIRKFPQKDQYIVKNKEEGKKIEISAVNALLKK